MNSRPNGKYYNYYNVLDVSIFADNSQIKKAYLNLHRRITDDEGDLPLTVNGDEINQELIEKAYGLLTTSSRRKAFDRALWKKLQKEDNHVSERPLTWTESYYMEGIGHLENENHEAALVCFLKLLKYDEKDNPILYRLVAEAYLMQGSISYAISAAEKSLEFNPDSDEATLLLGKLYEQDNQLCNARDCYVLAYKKNPHNSEIKIQYERGSLISERITILTAKTGKCFVPDKNAKSFRMKEGLISQKVLLDFVNYIAKLFTPMPNHLSFRLVKRG